jgi:hypothetical protein
MKRPAPGLARPRRHTLVAVQSPDLFTLPRGLPIW